MPTILFNDIVAHLSIPLEDFFFQDAQNVVRIVPTGRLLRHKKRELIRKRFEKTGKAVKNPSIHTLQTFVRSLASQFISLSQYHIIGDAYKLAMFEEAVEKAEIQYYRVEDETLGLPIIEQLASIISGLKKDGIYPSDLRRDYFNHDVQHSSLKSKQLLDIISVYEKYESLFSPTILDDNALTVKVTELLNQNFHIRSENQNSVIVIEGFTEFSLPEIHFISALSHYGYPCIIALEYSEGNGPLFGNLHETVQTFISYGFNRHNTEEQLHLSDATGDTLPVGACLRRWLFNTERQIHNGNFSESISLIKCKNRLHEVEVIGKLVKHLIIKESIKPGEITIAVKQPTLYSELFREVFRKYSIPANITDRYVLSKAPVVTALFSVADIALRGWRVKDIRRALASPYLYFLLNDDSSSEKTVIRQRNASANIQECARLLRISDSRRFISPQQWIQQLNRRITSTEQLLKDWSDTGVVDETESQQRKEEIQKLQRCKEDIEKLAELITLSKNVLLPSEFRALVTDNILKTLKVHKAIEDLYLHIASKRPFMTEAEYLMLEEEVEKDARALGTFIEVLDEFCYIQEQRFPNKKRSVIQFFARLRVAIHAARYQIREKHGFGVTITAPEQTRRIPSKVSILCGLVDGEFPEMYKPEQFLGIELHNTEERKIRTERMQFYEWLSNALNGDKNNKTYLFYPEADDGAEVVPSPFIEALLRISTLKSDGKCFSYHPKGQEQALPSWALAITTHQEDSDDLTLPITLTGDNNEVSDKVQQYIDKKVKSAVSITSLEEYGECPFKYFSNSILKIRQHKTVQSWFDNPDIGNLFHTIVYRFYAEQQTNKQTPVILNPELSNVYHKQLLSIAQQELQRVRFEHPYYTIEEARLLGDDISDGLLNVWLDNELQKISNGWDFHPLHFELSFGQVGKKTRPNQSVKLSENLNLRGKIDRIEVRENNERLEFIIADYKTGNAPPKNEIHSGRSLQLPLYTLVTMHLLSNNEQKTTAAVGGIYYLPFARTGEKYVSLPFFSESVKELPIYAGYKTLKPLQQGDFNQLLEQAVSISTNHLKRISETDFSIAPLPYACNKCLYSSVCRISEKEGFSADDTEFDD